ncbi:cytochrome oxidase putative small subunit CydP [Lysobacter capsici]|uniref:cytochrome oxidase putative small subunit CydP n=1 Tax=Lysobacter capsici TaxID=435897 RepID=UPI002E166915
MRTPAAPPRRDTTARHGGRLKRRVVVAIAAKLVLLTFLYLMFFSPSHRPRIDDAAVDRHLIPTR